MSQRNAEEMNEWRDEMRADAYEDDRYERRMRNGDYLFKETVDTLMEESCFLEYKHLLQVLCNNYGHDFDEWWEYSLDSL
jgi:hypothetical protein